MSITSKQKPSVFAGRRYALWRREGVRHEGKGQDRQRRRTGAGRAREGLHESEGGAGLPEHQRNHALPNDDAGETHAVQSRAVHAAQPRAGREFGEGILTKATERTWRTAMKRDRKRQ